MSAPDLSDMIFATSDTDRTLYQALIDAKGVHGAQRPVVEDVKREPMTCARLLTGSIALGRPLAALTRPG